MRIVIVGCGRLGGELATRMANDGDEVAVVDRDPQAFYRLGTDFNGRTIVGVGFDRDVLINAGIERADALAAVTSGDNTNFITARVARRIFRVPNVVARLYDPRRAEIYQRMGLPTFSPTTWGVERVMQMLAHEPLDVATTLGNGDVELVDLQVPFHWVSRTVNNVTVPGEITVTAISRGGRTFIPTLGTAFREGDRLIMTVLASSRSKLEDLQAVQ